MKKFIITFIVVIMTTPMITAQEKQLKQIDTNYYSYVEDATDCYIRQEGFYEKTSEGLKKCGEWKLYIKDELEHKAIYDNDELVELTVDGVTYSAKDLYIKKLEKKIEHLIADN